MRGLWFLLGIGLAVCPAFGAPVCAVTQPPHQVFVPPQPYDAVPYPGSFYFGSDDFWTILPANGVWGTRHHESAYARGNIVWFSKGYSYVSGQESRLKVEARKLDGSNQSLHGERATNGFLPDSQQSFLLDDIEFPSTGCWQITAQFRGQELKFTLLLTAPSN